MSINFSGIVINKNLHESIAELSEILHVNLALESEIDFETTNRDGTKEGFIDVFFGKNGTFVFANEDLCVGDGYVYPQRNILTFAVSETSMFFYFAYTENGNFIRSKMEVNGEELEEQGTTIDVEHENNDISELIWKQIDIVLGQKFWEIQLNEKVSRYRIKNSNESENHSQSIENKLIENKIAFEEKYQVPQTTKPNISHHNNDGDKMALMGLLIFAIVLVVGLVYVIYNVIMLL